MVYGDKKTGVHSPRMGVRAGVDSALHYDGDRPLYCVAIVIGSCIKNNGACCFWDSIGVERFVEFCLFLFTKSKGRFDRDHHPLDSHSSDDTIILPNPQGRGAFIAPLFFMGYIRGVFKLFHLDVE